MRPRRESEELWSPERIACTGWTDPARRAGAHAAATVTMTPSTTGTTTDCPVSMNVPGASTAPRLAAIAMSPCTSTQPAITPRPEPIRPTMIASPSTERVICRREVPRARSKANSRVRCATIMENVLVMIKVPTTKAMPAKAHRK